MGGINGNQDQGNIGKGIYLFFNDFGTFGGGKEGNNHPLSWEFRASSRREEMGSKVAKSTYSPFVMVVAAVFIKWLASKG